MSEPMRLSIDHVELYVPTRFEAADWYRRTLDLHIVEELLEWASDPEGPLVIGPAGGGQQIQLFQGHAAAGKGRAGLHRVAFATDAHGFLAFLEHVTTNPVYNDEGVETTEPLIADYGQAISAYFCDPYGTHLEVTTYETAAVRTRLGMVRASAEL